jgi:myo-inositol-1-phosphate synthase
MINETIVRKYLTAIDESSKDDIIVEILKSISQYDYNHIKELHLLEMLSDAKTIVKQDNIDIDYIKSEINNFVYHGDTRDITNVTIDRIDNLECTVTIGYDYKDNDSENKDYLHSSVNINFVDSPKILK